MADAARQQRETIFKKYFYDHRYADLVIYCRNGDEYDEYQVHQGIICPQSGFFSKATKGLTPRQNGGKRTVDLSKDDHSSIKRLMAFFYQGDYEPKLPELDRTGRHIVTSERDKAFKYLFPHTCDLHHSFGDRFVCPHHTCMYTPDTEVQNWLCTTCTSPPVPEGYPSQLDIHSRTYVIASKYEVPYLKALAKQKFERLCEAYWDTKEFVTFAEYMHASTFEMAYELRRFVYAIIASQPTLWDEPRMKALLQDGNFTLGVLKCQVADQFASKKRKRDSDDDGKEYDTLDELIFGQPGGRAAV